MNTLYKQLTATACALLLLLAQGNLAYAAELGGFPLGFPGGDDPGLQVELPTEASKPAETPPEEPPPQTDSGTQEPTEKQEVVSIFNLDLFLNGRILPVGDELRWMEEQQWIEEEFSFFGGLTAQGEEAALIPASIDCSAVAIGEVGSYEVTIRLMVADDYADGFFLPEALGTVHIPVYVTDPAEFSLYASAIKKDQVIVTWLYPSESHLPISVFYRCSDTVLASEDVDLLPCKDTIATATSTNSVLEINRDVLQTDKHYYFQIEQNGVYSDILHLVDDGRAVSSDGMGGDRDGGDRDEQTPPPVTITPPAVNSPDEDDEDDGDSAPPTVDVDDEAGTPPSIAEPPLPPVKDEEHPETDSMLPAEGEPAPVTPTPSRPQETPNPALKKPVSVPEEDTPNYTVFSGRRLLQMQKATDVLRVKKNHITVDLPWAWDGFSALTEDSRFQVELLSLSPDSISVGILLDGAPPLTALPMTVTMPYTPASDHASLSVWSQAEERCPATYDAASQTLTFTAEKPGTFTVSEQAEKPAVPAPGEAAASGGSTQASRNASALFIAGMAGIGMLVLAGGFWVIRRRRKGGHSHASR